MPTSSDLWTTGVRPWQEYFCERRAAPPPDLVASESLNPHEPYPDAARTKRISRFDPSALRHTVGNVTLDLAFVRHVLSTTGPVVTPADSSLWQFATQPGSFADIAVHESDYYDWFNWVLSYPAASAVNAVRDQLYRDADVPLPPNYSRTNKVNKTSGGGVADILHQWSHGHVQTPCTPHEFKREKALRVDDQSVLDFLFEQAGSAGHGYAFRSTAPISTLEGKGKSIVSQVINEMLTTDTGHAIVCTQTQYVMLRVTDLLQLEISPVYAVLDSTTQFDDMALLVLFYMHAALRAGQTYAAARATWSTAMRVTLPAFPTSVFHPYEGVFRGAVIGRTKLVSKSSGSFFPLPWAWFDGNVQSSSNEFTIAHGRLIFLLFASSSVVAKTAHGTSATQRLVHEYDAYTAMRSIQGAAIPKIIGMFGTKDGENTVLMMSYAGKALKAFSELELHDKLTLFHRLVRLHKTGVQHNDLEPRNVTKSSSGPLIIDFDRASLDHNCPGASCKELLQVAQALHLDSVEMETFQEERVTSPNPIAIIVIFAVISVVVFALFGLPLPRNI